MLNISKWITNYESLDPANQLKVADAITKELSFNESIYSEQEYDLEKSEIVRKLFESTKQETKNEKKKQKITGIYERYESLSPKNKEKVFNEVVDNILKVACEQEEEEKRKICNSEGHVFGKWKIRTWTTKELYWDAGPQGYFNVKHKDWERKCERCGYIEKAEEKPQELVDEIKEKNRIRRVKRLEKTLDSLKSEEK